MLIINDIKNGIRKYKMFNFLKRVFLTWHRIPKHNVPKWVRGKLYKNKYIRDKRREYKVILEKRSKTISKYPEMQGHIPITDHGKVTYIQTWRKAKYYYRNIR